jgi:hypothetical protein
MKLSILAAVVFIALTAPAFAGDCNGCAVQQPDTPVMPQTPEDTGGQRLRHSVWPTVPVAAAAPSNSPTRRSSCRHQRTVATTTTAPRLRFQASARRFGRSLWRTPAAVAAASRLAGHQQVRQLGYAGCDLPRFVLGHEMRRGAPAWLAFEIHVGHGEVVRIADDVGDAAILLDGPWCGEAAFSHGSI